MKKTVQHKVIKVMEQEGSVVAKALTLTVICAVFIIVAWVVLDRAELHWLM